MSFDACISLRSDRRSASTTGSLATDAGRADTSRKSALKACVIFLRALSSGRELLPRACGLATSLIPMERRRFLKEKMRELSSLISGLSPDEPVRTAKMSTFVESASRPAYTYPVYSPSIDSATLKLISSTVSRGLSTIADSSARRRIASLCLASSSR